MKNKVPQTELYVLIYFVNEMDKLGNGVISLIIPFICSNFCFVAYEFISFSFLLLYKYVFFGMIFFCICIFTVKYTIQYNKESWKYTVNLRKSSRF